MVFSFLLDGMEIVAETKQVNIDTITLNNPVRVVIKMEEGSLKVNLIPFMPYATVTLSTKQHPGWPVDDRMTASYENFWKKLSTPREEIND